MKLTDWTLVWNNGRDWAGLRKSKMLMGGEGGQRGQREMTERN